MALFPASNMGAVGLDPSNVLHRITTENGSWTATSDCWCVGGMGKGTSASQTEIYLNNVKILIQWSAQAGSTDAYPVCFPVKKGQTVKTRNIAGQLYDLSFYAIA